MTSERPAASASATDALRRVLTAAGRYEPTGREIAELLWLAARMRPEPVIGPDSGEAPRLPPRPPGPGPAAGTPEREPEPPGPSPAGRADGPEPERVPLRTPPPLRPAPDPAGGGEHAPLLAPAPAMLAHPLALQRAVRPLKRRVPSAHRREFDEAATAHRGALLGPRPQWWLPVLRPRPERWLHLRIVFDAGPTMTMWRPLLRDLHRALAQTGAFRTVETVALAPDGTLAARQAATSRTAVLVLSDCMGPQWRDGPAGARLYRTLRGWAKALPVAVVQPLPERLWQYTAFAPAAGLLSAPGPGAAAASLTFLPYEPAPPHRPGGGVPVPVLMPSAPWLRNWAELVGARGGAQVPGSAALLGQGPPVAARAAEARPADLPAEELVLRFRSVASPAAFRLAAHLAVGCAHLPVMRLVHAAVEARPQPQHLAEVVLSGMLTAVPGPPGAYEFRPGVRRVLLGTLPHTAHVRTSGLLGRVNARLEAMAGAVPGEFRALVAARGGPVGAVPGAPFALVSRESVRLLRGPREDGAAGRVLAGRYELRARIGDRPPGQVWRAAELPSGRRVAVTLYLFPADRGPAPTSAFLADARRVAALHHPNLLLNFDAFAVEDAWCLVAELVDAPTLRETLSAHPDGLPPDAVERLARELLSALDALHAADIVHGGVRAENVLLSPERGALLCDPGVRHDPGPEPADDLLDAGMLLLEAALNTRLPSATLMGAPNVRRDHLASLPPALASVITGLLDDAPGARGLAAAELLSAPSSTRRVYRLLGPPEAWVGGTPAPDADGPALRMLCALVLARGERVAGTELWEPHWREDVHDVARRLTRLGHPVRSAADGTYRLTLKGADVDLLGVEQLVFQAEEAESAGDRGLALERYGTALGLWAGEPLAGMPGAWADRHRQELAELLRTVTGRRAALSDESAEPVVVLRVTPDEDASAVQDALMTAMERVFGVRPEVQRLYGTSVQLLARPGDTPSGVVRRAVAELPRVLARDVPYGVLDTVRLSLVVQSGSGSTTTMSLLAMAPDRGDGGAGALDVCVQDSVYESLDAPDTEGFERHEYVGGAVWFRRIAAPEPGNRLDLAFPLPSAVDGLAFAAEAVVAWQAGADAVPLRAAEVRQGLGALLGPLVRDHGLARLDLAQVRVDARLGEPLVLRPGGPRVLARVTLRPALAPLRTLLGPVRHVLVDHDGTLSRPRARDAVRALAGSGRRIVVVTGGRAGPVEEALGAEAAGLVEIRQLTTMGDDAILQSMGSVADALVIGRMPGAATTAARLGAPYVGLADGPASAADLRAAGATLVTTSLGAIVEALEEG
ncbi:SAV_2336 N-terminal domain-related protein [Streptomyces sp. cg36]|uniref:SAV_2336 N-terminal domain-related protein n=1 Tax=Streptomyces sp. cg36 TaxID=3238798 RepID=UPI0034E1FCF1